MSTCYTYVYMCAYVHTSPTEHPTHSPGMACSRFSVDVCTKAVEGEVLHNRVDPLTLRGHHSKLPPMHLPDVNIQLIWIVARTCWPSVHTYNLSLQAIRSIDNYEVVDMTTADPACYVVAASCRHIPVTPHQILLSKLYIYSLLSFTSHHLISYTWPTPSTPHTTPCTMSPDPNIFPHGDDNYRPCLLGVAALRCTLNTSSLLVNPLIRRLYIQLSILNIPLEYFSGVVQIAKVQNCHELIL